MEEPNELLTFNFDFDEERRGVEEFKLLSHLHLYLNSFYLYRLERNEQPSSPLSTGTFAMLS
jgi:hypothetical protein